MPGSEHRRAPPCGRHCRVLEVTDGDLKSSQNWRCQKCTSNDLGAMSKALVKIPDEMVARRVFAIRGERVMLDRDLAVLYGV